MSDHLGVRGRIQEFHERHGGECYPDGGYYWYANGAHREVNPLGALIEPAETSNDRGKYELAEAKLNFHKAKLNAAVREFQDLKEDLRFWTPNDGGEAAFKRLKELRSIVQRGQEDVRKAQAALDNTYIGGGKKSVQERLLYEAARHNEWKKKLEAIRI
jgi:hypothetical protein